MHIMLQKSGFQHNLYGSNRKRSTHTILGLNDKTQSFLTLFLQNLVLPPYSRISNSFAGFESELKPCKCCSMRKSNYGIKCADIFVQFSSGLRYESLHHEYKIRCVPRNLMEITGKYKDLNLESFLCEASLFSLNTNSVRSKYYRTYSLI